MEITLPPEVMDIIDRHIAAGQNHSPTEVIVQALWLLDGWHDSESERVAKLRRAVQQGLEGPFTPGAETMAGLRAKPAAQPAGQD